jgi:NADH-quinone oxidoreductase subunit C
MHANIVAPHLKYQTPEHEALRVSIESKLLQRFGKQYVSSSLEYDFPTFIVKRESAIDVLEFLYHDTELDFKFLTTLCVTHQPERADEEFGVVYHLHNLLKNWRIRVKTYLPLSHPHVRTATSLFRAANWLERQEYDFFGVVFDGHPNLKRILNMDEMTYHPMRKEYPLEDARREDKDDAFFGR